MIGYRRCYSLAYADDADNARILVTAFTFYAGLESGAVFLGDARTVSVSQSYAFDPTRQGTSPLHFGGGGVRLGGFVWRGLSISGELRVGIAPVAGSMATVSDTIRVRGATEAGYVAAALFTGYTVSLGSVSLRGEIGAGLREAWVNTLVQYGEELSASDVHALHTFGAARATMDVFLGPNSSLSFAGECDVFPTPAFVGTVGLTYHGRGFDLLR
jgi:hypothetical protein